MGLRATLAAAGLSLLTVAGAWAAGPPQPGAKFIKVWYERRIAHIQPVGLLYNGETERDAGSGLLIGESLVLTANHVIPVPENYQKFSIEVRLGDPQVNPILATLLVRDAANDVALLRLDQAVALNPPRCPIEGMIDGAMLPDGSTVFVMGFPVNKKQSITSGIISSRAANGRLQTEAAINPGNSGGPVFSEKGYLVGVAESAIRSFDRGDAMPVGIQGINFLVPTSSFLQGDILAHLSKDPSCLSKYQPNAEEIAYLAALEALRLEGLPPGGGGGATPTPPEGATVSNAVSAMEGPMLGRGGGASGNGTLAMPEGGAGRAAAARATADRLAAAARVAAAARTLSEISSARGRRPESVVTMASDSAAQEDMLRMPRTFAISHPATFTNDEHPDAATPHRQIFRKTVAAESGYRITNCDPDVFNAAHAEPAACKIATDAKSATLTVGIFSGPKADAWRGLWQGEIRLQQLIRD